MLTASDALEEARPIAAALVAREARRSGSKMAAYQKVARDVGTSASWVRKLVGRQEVAVLAHHFLNLRTAYDRACARWEAEAEAEKRAFMALRDGGSDAVVESALSGRAVEGDARRPSPVAPREGG